MKSEGMQALWALLPELDSEAFSAEHFKLAGVYVIRNAIPRGTVTEWQAAWHEFYRSRLSTGRNVNRFNPVAVDEQPSPPLSEMYRFPALLDLAERAFGPDIALYNQRFVIKDRHSRSAVFLHQDFPYHIGWPRKASAFVALSVVNANNGGMVFYPGTHRFGYLGDAGEIDSAVIGPAWPSYAPAVEPGDVVLMNSLTWHRSVPHVSGPDRILADIIYQPSDDPSGIELLRGRWRTDFFLDRRKTRIFLRSRTTRLAELQREADAGKTEGAA